MSAINPNHNSTATGRRRRGLRRTVLGVAAAAIVAVWLPFSVLYVSAVHHSQPVVRYVTGGKTTRLITTRTSTGVVTVAAAPGGPAAAASTPAAPVTRSS